MSGTEWRRLELALISETREEAGTDERILVDVRVLESGHLQDVEPYFGVVGSRKGLGTIPFTLWKDGSVDFGVQNTRPTDKLNVFGRELQKGDYVTSISGEESWIYRNKELHNFGQRS